MLPTIIKSILAIIMLVITGCTMVTAPLEFAPNGDIVERAIALQLQQNQQTISQQLNTSLPQLAIKQIVVQKIEPMVITNLPTYHLQGTYNLTLNLPRQQAQQNPSYFDIYIQRQKQGTTWRLLKQKQNQWYSYLIN